jgi:hypothetical protein
MRAMLVVLAGLGMAWAAEAKASDWRAMPVPDRDVGFVDADSVRRSADGTIRFQARFLLGEDNPSGDLGYDRWDTRASARCVAGGEPTTVRASRTFSLRGAPSTVGAWKIADANRSTFAMAEDLCGGLIGYRSFGTPEAAMGEYARHRSAEQLSAYLSEEVELTGTVVQGFEINGVELCGSESGCVDDAPAEFCWLEGDVSLPAPPGASPEAGGSYRRDTAQLAFRGRISRSRSGRGFGHVGAFGCQVELTGPARPATITQRRPAVPDFNAPGRRPEALAARAALDEAIGRAGEGVAVEGSRRVPFNRFSPVDERYGGGCSSQFQLGEAYPSPAFSGLSWEQVSGVAAAGPAVNLVMQKYDESADFHFATPAAAAALAAMIEELRSERVEAVEQAGGRVMARLAGGRRFERDFGSAALAVEAAGLIGTLRGRELATVRRNGAQVTAMTVRRVTLSFADEAKAGEVGARMEALRLACVPAGS